MSSNRLLVVRNKNTLDAVAEEYMLMVGASTDRDLTGQGLGTKFVGIRSAVDGLKFGRASWDRKGKYLAWYEVEGYQLGDGSMRERAVLVVKRPTGTNRFPMTVDTNLVLSGWTRHPMGNAFPTIREAILDAADEDVSFKIAHADEMTYSPEGETWTFVEETQALSDLMEVPGYYFHNANQMTWLSKTVAIADACSVNEAQLFVTAGENPRVAYAAWTSGRDKKDAVPSPVYDYILKETKNKKWASMPKRLLEDVSAAKRTVVEAIMESRDPDVMSKVLQSVIDGGWEECLPWTSTSWYWNTNTAREAFRKVVGDRPIHNSNKDELFIAAQRRGYRPISLPNWMYIYAKETLNFRTVHNALNIREKGEVELRPLDGEQRGQLLEALNFLEKHYPWQGWRTHVYVSAVTDKNSRLVGLHIPGDRQDRIAINFAHSATDTVRGLAMTIIHEQVHHELNQNSADSNHHSDLFADTMLELLTVPQNY